MRSKLLLITLIGAIQISGEPIIASIENNKTNRIDYFIDKILNRSDVIIGNLNRPINDKVHRPIVKTFVDDYEAGVQAYLANDWEACVTNLERSVSGYRDYYEATASCRIRCELIRNTHPPMYVEDIEHLHFFEGTVRKTLCIKKCIGKLLPMLVRGGGHFSMASWAKWIFENRTPYEYLQLCYYRQKEIKKAIASTYVVLVRNPNNTMMMKNMKFYIEKLPDFNLNRILDELDGRQFGDKLFTSFYRSGLAAYDRGDWKLVIESMEQSLNQYLHDLDLCRAFCEGEFDQGWLPDFTSSIANHFTYCLRCKRNCTFDMEAVRGKLYDNLFASHYEYLQFAYYKNDQIREACQAVSSFLLFAPNSIDGLENLKFYKELDSVTDSYFVVRQEAKRYYNRFRYEEDILNFINVEFERSISDNSMDDILLMPDLINLQENN